jgi:hypothetical protein
MKSLVLLTVVILGQVAAGDVLAQFREVECLVENYKPKSEAKLSAMSPRGLIDERVKNNPNSFGTYSANANYEELIEKLIRRAGIKALPVISEYLDSYDYKNRNSFCSELRFTVVSILASNIDSFDFRLRATKEGQAVINSLEKALQQIVTAEPGITFMNGSEDRHQPAAFIFLKELKGINDADRSVADTLWVRYKIKLSETEISEFTNYLISRDPKYPAWSKFKFIKDYSRINEAGNPAQVYVFDNAKLYYQAYLNFKRSQAKAKR